MGIGEHKKLSNYQNQNELNVYIKNKNVGSEVAQLQKRKKRRCIKIMRHLFLSFFIPSLRSLKVESVRSMGQPIVLKNFQDKIDYRTFFGTCFCTACASLLLCLSCYIAFERCMCACIEQLNSVLCQIV